MMMAQIREIEFTRVAVALPAFLAHFARGPLNVLMDA